MLDHQGEYETQWAAITSIAEKFGMTAETLRKWVRRAEVDQGARPGITTAEQQRIRELERENRELRCANEILKAASASSRRSSTRDRDDDRLLDTKQAPVGSRADLQGAADRPIDLLRRQG